jgi:hypothetical protein
MDSLLNYKNSLRPKIRKFFESVEEATLEGWLFYNLTMMMLGILLVPLVFLIDKGLILVSTLIVYFFLGLFSNVEVKVGEKYPTAFLKVEKLKCKISLSFWFLFVIMAMLIGFTFLLDLLNTAENVETVNSVFYWVVLVWTGITFYLTSFSGASIVKSKPLLKLRARVRFQLFLESLSKKNQKKAIKEISLLLEGIKLCNVFLRKNYDLVIKEPQKYYDYAKIMTLSGEESKIEEIKIGLRKLLKILKEKKEATPLEIIGPLKEAMGEPISDSKDIMSEVYVEPRLRKWFLSNLQVIVAIVEITSLLIVIFGFVLGR